MNDEKNADGRNGYCQQHNTPSVNVQSINVSAIQMTYGKVATVFIPTWTLTWSCSWQGLRLPIRWGNDGNDSNDGKTIMIIICDSVNEIEIRIRIKTKLPASCCNVRVACCFPCPPLLLKTLLEIGEKVLSQLLRPPQISCSTLLRIILTQTNNSFKTHTHTQRVIEILQLTQTLSFAIK